MTSDFNKELSPIPASLSIQVNNSIISQTNYKNNRFSNNTCSSSQLHFLENYHDFTDIVRHYYHEQNLAYSINLSSQISQIDQWIQQEGNNKPILISADQLQGKKAIICQLFQHLSKRKNYFVHAEFASVNPNYSQILACLTTKIKQCLNITQKVQLNQQKLRRYFKYWLQIANNICQKQSIGYEFSNKKQIIIFIQGIDLVVDSKGQHVPPNFWLPLNLPKHVKIIVSANKKSTDASLLKEIQCKILDYSISKQKKKKIILQINKSLQSSCSQLTIFQIKLIDRLIKKFPKFNIDLNGKSFKQILLHFIESVKTSDLDEKMIKNCLLLLATSRKGLIFKQIQKILKIDPNILNQFLQNFQPIISVYNDTLNIWHPKLKKVILDIVDPLGDRSKYYIIQISKYLKRMDQTTRTLEQNIHQLIKVQNYIQLKQTLSKIQNFLLLYTPYTKHLLCFCWNKLQSLQHDPVFQYNKAIENFLSHYYLKQEQVFKIIFELSLFFKEYADFQNAKTPQFRHPYIRGENAQLQSICMYQELKKLKMIKKQRDILKKKNAVPKITKRRQSKSREKKIIINKANPKLESTSSEKFQSSNQLLTKYQEKIAEQSSTNEVGKSVTNQIEGLNINIISNQQKFRETYMSIMKDYLSKYYKSSDSIIKKNCNQKQYKIITQDQDSDQQIQKDNFQGKQIEAQIQKIKESFILKNINEYRQQNYHKSGEEQKYYYYKQWLWLQFPWIGQSISSDFSNLIQQCITSPTEYMSIQMEQNLIIQAQKVAKIAKNNKLQIYKRNKSQEHQPSFLDKSAINQSNFNSKKSQVTLKSPKQSRLNALSAPQKGLKDSSMNYSKWKLNISQLRQEIAKTSVASTTRMKNIKAHQSQLASSIFVTENPNLEKSQCTQSYSTSRFQLPNINPLSQNLKFNNNCMKKKKRQFDMNENAIQNQRHTLQKSNIEQKNDSSLSKAIKKHNQLKYDNQMLVSKIENLKNSVIMIENGKNKQRTSKISDQISKLEQQKQKIKKSFDQQHTLKQKLETIIKICDINKAHGSQSEQLNNFLTSLKFMIGIQHKKNQEIKLKLNSVIEQYRKQMKRIKENKKSLEKDLVHQKKKDRIMTIKTQKYLILQKQMGQRLSKINKKKTQTIVKSTKVDLNGTNFTSKSKKGIKSKNNDQNNEKAQLFKNVQDLQKALEKIQVFFGQNSQNDQILNEFQYVIEKNLQLYDGKQEQYQKLIQTQQKTSLCQLQIKCLSKKAIYDKIGRIKQQILNKRQRLNQIKNRKKLLSQCLAINQNIIVA